MTKEELIEYYDNEKKKIDYSYLPEHMREPARDWIEKGWEPGSFLTLILKNDFVHAASKADHLNQEKLFDWARWLWNLPQVMWGQHYDYWQKIGGIDGHLKNDLKNLKEWKAKKNE